MLKSDYVIGMASMVLLEAAGLGIPVASLEPERELICNPGIDVNEAIYKARTANEMAPTLRTLFETDVQNPQPASRLDIQAVAGQVLDELAETVRQKRR